MLFVAVTGHEWGSAEMNRSASESLPEQERGSRRARRLLLAVFVMAAFLILEVVLANKIGASGWLRVFGWSIGVY